MPIKYSPKLFSDKKGMPLVFLVEDCDEKNFIVSLIEKCGGNIIEQPVEDALLLAGKGFTDYNPSTETYLGIDYITSCCMKNNILKFKKFLLNPGYKYNASFQEDLQTLIHSLELKPTVSAPSTCAVQQETTDESITELNAQNSNHASKQAKLSSNCIDPTSSDDDFLEELNDGLKKQKVPGASHHSSSKTIGFRRPYSSEECKAMIDFIVSEVAFSITKGNTLWKKIEREKICPGRTWQSLKEHFRRKVLPLIEHYTKDKDVVKKFRNVVNSSSGWQLSKEMIPLSSTKTKALTNTFAFNNKEEEDQTFISSSHHQSSEPSTSKNIRDQEVQEESTHGYQKGIICKTQSTKKKHSKPNTVIPNSSSSENDDQNDNDAMDGVIEDLHQSDPIKHASLSEITIIQDLHSNLIFNNASVFSTASSCEIQSNPFSLKDGQQAAKASFSNDGIAYRNLNSAQEPENNEGAVSLLSREQLSINCNPVLHEFRTLQCRVLRCRVVSISPFLPNPMQDLVSGYCPACFSLAVYSEVEFTDAEKTTGLCCKCLEHDEEICLVFIFWVVLELSAKNNRVTVTVAGNDGRDFFGCTEKEYLVSTSLQEFIRDNLQRLLSHGDRLSRLEGVFTCTKDNSPFPNRIFLSNCSLTDTVESNTYQGMSSKV